MPQVEDVDDFFEDAMAAASEHDSEDSNAESYYANSYPDDDEYGSEDDEEDKEWCHVHRAAGTAGGGHRGGNSRWDDEVRAVMVDVLYIPPADEERPLNALPFGAPQEYDLTVDGSGDECPNQGKAKAATLARRTRQGGVPSAAEDIRRQLAGGRGGASRSRTPMDEGAWGYRIR